MYYIKYSIVLYRYGDCICTPGLIRQCSGSRLHTATLHLQTASPPPRSLRVRSTQTLTNSTGHYHTLITTQVQVLMYMQVINNLLLQQHVYELVWIYRDPRHNGSRAVKQNDTQYIIFKKVPNGLWNSKFISIFNIISWQNHSELLPFQQNTMILLGCRALCHYLCLEPCFRSPPHLNVLGEVILIFTNVLPMFYQCFTNVLQNFDKMYISTYNFATKFIQYA